MRYRAVLTVIGPVDPRRPWLSTASTRRLWRPGRSNPGFRLSAYGDVVSEPRGTPSSRNVTATMRPESDMASAFNVAGRKMRPVGPRKRTLSGSETAAEGRDTAAASNAKAIAAHRFPRNTLEEDCLAADAMMCSTGGNNHLLGRSLSSRVMADRK